MFCLDLKTDNKPLPTTDAGSEFQADVRIAACCIMMLHNRTNSSNRSVDMIVSISLSLAPSSKCLRNFCNYMVLFINKQMLLISFLYLVQSKFS